MIAELAGNIEHLTGLQYKKHIAATLKYLSEQGIHSLTLDIGERSPLTEAIENNFNVKIFNTSGDLDADFVFPLKIYDNIIYSHTIEHQFSPLNTLLRVAEVMDRDSKLFIMLPSRGKLLWCPGHYHEIDHYRMQLLIKRAGLKITDYQRRKHWRAWWFYLTGCKAFMRLFFEYNAYYIVRNG